MHKLFGVEALKDAFFDNIDVNRGDYRPKSFDDFKGKVVEYCEGVGQLEKRDPNTGKMVCGCFAVPSDRTLKAWYSEYSSKMTCDEVD